MTSGVFFQVVPVKDTRRHFVAAIRIGSDAAHGQQMFWMAGCAMYLRKGMKVDGRVSVSS